MRTSFTLARFSFHSGPNRITYSRADSKVGISPSITHRTVKLSRNCCGLLKFDCVHKILQIEYWKNVGSCAPNTPALLNFWKFAELSTHYLKFPFRHCGWHPQPGCRSNPRCCLRRRLKSSTRRGIQSQRSPDGRSHIFRKRATRAQPAISPGNESPRRASDPRRTALSMRPARPWGLQRPLPATRPSVG